MYKIYIICVFGLFLGIACTNPRQCTVKNEPFTVTFQFEETKFFQQTGNFFEIKVDLEQGIFSKPKPIVIQHIDSSNADKESTSNNRSMDNIHVIWDTSPDQKWISEFELFDKFHMNTHSGSYLFSIKNRSNNEKVQVPSQNKIYFSSDSESAFFIYNWNLLKIKLTENILEAIKTDFYKAEPFYKEESLESKFPQGSLKMIDKATTFFQTSDRKQLIIFYNHSISRMDINSGEKKEIGKYKYIAYDSGPINQRYGYFITAISNKGGAKYFSLLDLKNKRLRPCPFSIPESRVISVIIADK
jgi:hypothetical protein